MTYGGLYAEIAEQRSPVKPAAHDIMDFTPSIFKLKILGVNSRLDSHIYMVVEVNVFTIHLGFSDNTDSFKTDIQLN